MKNYTSKLEEVIAQAWTEPSLEKAKALVVDCISNSRIKSKDSILYTLSTIKSKYKLDYYLANSLLKFEGMSLN
jgi:hypothetical protein